MPYKEILLTKRLFLLKMYKLKKYQDQLNIRQKPEINRAHLDIINKSIENNVIYCKICGEPIDETFIGKTIVLNKNSRSYAMKWRHLECCIAKNMVVERIMMEEELVINVQN